MKLIDVSLEISPEMMVWPNDPPVSVEPAHRIARGDVANVSLLRLGSHTGTHVDPPCHFIEGAPAVDAIPLDALVGPAVVADLRGVSGAIGPEDLERLALPEGTERLLFRTDNSEIWGRRPARFPDSYVALSPEGARWVLARGIRLVGTDFLSIERAGAPGHPVHVALLSAGIVILEGLDLSGVEPGSYTLLCLPLKVAGGDGAPARAVLMDE